MKCNNIKACAGCCLLLVLSACASPESGERNAQAPVGRASLPVFQGWYSNRPVLYLVTDISDPAMAQSMGSNLSPRLSASLPPSPRPADWQTVLEKVYATDDPAQAKIFASVPEPIGGRSKDANYSPLWQMVKFRWLNAKEKVVLHSEAEVLNAEAAGRVVLERTSIIINCPVVALDGQMLEGVRISRP